MHQPFTMLRRFFVLLFIASSFLSACTTTANADKVQPGMAAPDFSLAAVHGDSYHLADLAGQTVLLSFINTQAKAGSATADPSRAQIVFIKSMHEQYSPNGLVVLIVDAARVETGSSPDQDELINFTYDWQLDGIPVLEDRKSATAKTYGVSETPVTFLIGADGMIQQRWDGFASASQLALSIEPLVGAPPFRATDSASTSPTTAAPVCVNETQPQAKFAGVGLARPLSNDLWVVDGGIPWGTGAAFPLQFIFLDTQNAVQQQGVHIHVFIKTTASSQEILLLDQTMELLPPDVASGLLSGTDDPAVMYSLVTSVQIEEPGCLDVRAVITQEGNANPLIQGKLIVPAR